MPSITRFALSCSLLFAAACDETPRDVQRDYLVRERDAFVLQVPRGKILAQIDSLLADEGLAVATRDGDTLHTTKRADLPNGTLELSIHLIGLASGATQVQIMSIRRDAGAVQFSERSTDREWLLAQRADPDRAQAILRAGNERADEIAPRARPRAHDPR